MASKPDPKLPNERQQTISPRPSSSSPFRVLAAFGSLFLIVVVVIAAYHACEDLGTFLSVFWFYANLLLLFWCLKKIKNLGADSPHDKREGLKVAIWVLATALNFNFSGAKFNLRAHPVTHLG